MSGRKGRETRGLLAADSLRRGGVDDDGFVGAVHRAGSSVQLASRYVGSSIQRDRRGFCIGLTTVTMVVTITALLQSAIEIAPVIFMKLAEDQAGEADIVLTAEYSASNPLPVLNYTAINASLAAQGGDSGFRGASPRWPLLTTFASAVAPSQTATGYTLAIDSLQEQRIGLGRNWKRRALGPAECYASSSVLAEIGVQAGAGQQLDVTFDIQQILGAVASAATGSITTGGGSSSNATATTPQARDAALLQALLTAAGIDITALNVNVNALVALQVALQAAGLGAAVNVTAIEQAFPGLEFITVDATPIVAQALASAASALAISNRYTVVDEVPSPGGKYPTLLGNVVVLEARYLVDIVKTAVAGAVDQVLAVVTPLAQAAGNPGLSQTAGTIATTLEGIARALPNVSYENTMLSYALEVDVVSSGRETLYLRSASGTELGFGSDKMTDALVGSSLGFAAPVNVVTPLADGLLGLQFIALFLSQIFTVVLAVLALLGAVVIYALVLGDVEAKTYELGMLRALGLKHATLAELLGIQTLAFAAPGIALGLTVSSLLNLVIVAVLQWYAGVSVSSAMYPKAWIYGVVLGAAVPAIAVIVPIRRALTATLRDALDLSHQVTHDITVTAMKLSEKGLSPAQTALAVMLVVIGFVTFYLLPLSFLFRDFALFLGVLTGILLGMLVGLSILSQALQPIIERWILSAMLFVTGDWGRLHTVTHKALAGHRPRNSKTSYLISITIGFLVFAAAMFGLQATSIVTNVRLFLGADIVAILLPGLIPSTASTTAVNSLPQADLTAYLDGLLAKGAASSPITSYTWVSMPLTASRVVSRSWLGNLVGIPVSQTVMWGVQENYLSVAFDDYSIITEAAGQGIDAATVASTGDVTGLTAASAASAWVSKYPIRALYEGAGSLSLPVEEALSAPPLPVGTGSYEVPLYVCDASVAAASAAYDASLYAGTNTAANSSAQPLPAASCAGSRQSLWQLGTNGLAPAADWGVVNAGLTANATLSFPAAMEYVASCGPYGCETTSSGDVRGALPPPPQPFHAFADYDYCLLSCSYTADIAANQSRSGSNSTVPPPRVVCLPADDATAALQAQPATRAAGGGDVPSTPAFPFYAASASDRFWATGGQLSAYPSLAALLNGGNDSSHVVIGNYSAAGQICWVLQPQLSPPTGGAGASPCFTSSRASPAEQADRVSAAYLTYIDVIMSEAMRGGASLSTTTPLALRAIARDPASSLTSSRVYLAKARAMARKMPGFLFSSYSQTFFRSPVLARMRDVSRLYSTALDDYAAIRTYVDDTTAAASASASTGAPASASSGSSSGSSNATAAQRSAAAANVTAAWAAAGSTVRAASCASGNTSNIGAGIAVDSGFPYAPAWLPSKPAWGIAAYPPAAAGLPVGAVGWSSPPTVRDAGRILPFATDNDAATLLWSPPQDVAAIVNATASAALDPLPAFKRLKGLPVVSATGTVRWVGGAPPEDADRAAAEQSAQRAAVVPAPGALRLTARGAAQTSAAPVIAVDTSAMAVLDLGRCGLVSGIQVAAPAAAQVMRAALLNASSPVGPLPADVALALRPAPGGIQFAGVVVSLYALSDATGKGHQLIGQGLLDVTAAVVSGSAPAEASVAFSFAGGGYSARYWGVVTAPVAVARYTTPLLPPTTLDLPVDPALLAVNATGLPVPDLQLLLSRVANGVCEADELAADDAVLAMPKSKLLVRVRPGATDVDRQRVINGIKSFLRSPLITVQDTQALLASTDVAVLGLNAFFYFVAALALILAFFATLLSFTANVSENSIEFGILRSLGLPAAAVVRAYVYEALTVVLTSFLLGTGVGLLVAITLTLQFNLFTEAPFVFTFPVGLFLLTLLGSIVLAIVASCVPARTLTRAKIAGVLKGRVQA